MKNAKKPLMQIFRYSKKRYAINIGCIHNVTVKYCQPLNAFVDFNKKESYYLYQENNKKVIGNIHSPCYVLFSNQQ